MRKEKRQQALIENAWHTMRIVAVDKLRCARQDTYTANYSLNRHLVSEDEPEAEECYFNNVEGGILYEQALR
jgi:hypothetical protein